MAVFQWQLLPSTTMLMSQGLPFFMYCLQMLKAHCSTGPLCSGSTGLVVCQKDLKKQKTKQNKVLPMFFEIFIYYFFLAKQQTFSVWKTQTWGDVLEQTARTNRASYLTVVLKECPCLVLIYWSYVLLGVTVVLETFVIKVVVGPWLLKETW